MQTTILPIRAPLMPINNQDGIIVTPSKTPLTALNYFDGKFLRAADLTTEQLFERYLVEYSNRAGGHGVAYGYDVISDGTATFEVGPGLAIDAEGGVLLLVDSVSLSLQDLIEKSRQIAALPAPTQAVAADAFGNCVVAGQTPATVSSEGGDWFVLTVGQAELLCGQEDVYGKLCEEACITSTDRPFRIETVIFRLRPLQLTKPLPTSSAVAITNNQYLRSRLASAYFEMERWFIASQISKAGLTCSGWCLGAPADAGSEVPLAVIVRTGAGILFSDPWIVRRERMDPPSRRYWQWRMAMRPWDVFMAQVLQFQCQLHACVGQEPTPPENDPCAQARKLAAEAANQFDALTSYLKQTTANLARDVNLSGTPPSLTQIADLRDRLLKVGQAFKALPTNRLLIYNCGIVELPSAGYLPVVPGVTLTVNRQVRRLMGEGVDLRFCVVRPDYVPHVLEEAQHMERISLVQGLDDPSNMPKVDIFVPWGKILSGPATPDARLYDADYGLAFGLAANNTAALYKGAAREVALDSGGTTLYTALAGISQEVVKALQAFVTPLAKPDAADQAITFTPSFVGNEFIKSTATLGARMDARVTDAASQARNFSAAAVGGIRPIPQPIVIPNEGTVDGLWLTATVEKEIKSLAIGEQTPVSLRIVLGTQPNSPLAIELKFAGTLSIDSIPSSTPILSLTGSLNGLLSVAVFQEKQNLQRIIEFLFSERFTWPVTLTYTGDDAAGSITLDLALTTATPSAGLRVAKFITGASTEISYRLSLTSTDATGAVSATPFGQLHLLADADVINAPNLNHQYAEKGLDIVQAALILSEPSFKANSEGLLFPTLPPGSQELTIEAVSDWVLFARRREAECALDVQPLPPPPPRSYRVVNITVQADADPAAEAKAIDSVLHDPDPAKISEEIQSLLVSQDRKKATHLVVKFSGASATPLSDLAAAEVDWKSFNPGGIIYYAAIGAVGETDSNLQLNRVKAFEAAIASDSNEDPTAKEATIIPYPQDAEPPDADGIMLFITTPISEKQHVYGANVDGFGQVLKIANTPNAGQTLARLLANESVRDLGLATYTVPSAGAVSVDDQLVQTNFKTPVGRVVDQALELAQQGDPAPTYDRRFNSAKQIVTDLGGDPTKLQGPLTFQGTWPIADAPSIVVVQEHVVQQPPTTARFVLSNLRPVIAEVPPPPLTPQQMAALQVSFQGNNTLTNGSFPQATVDFLKNRIGNLKIASVQLATRGDPNSPASFAQLKSIVDALTAMGVGLSPTAQKGVVALSSLSQGIATQADTPSPVDVLILLSFA